jgi:EmrB/QacA subfamily drug resistance transporter
MTPVRIVAVPRGRTSHTASFAVLTTGVMAYALLQSLVIPVLPTISHDLHTSQSTVTWVLTAYLLSASVFTPIVGRLGDMWGKERMLVVTLSALAIGCVLSAVASSIGLMIAGRVIQGAGGGLLPLSFGIIRDEFPQERVAGAVGTLAALTAVGGGAGIVVAGPLVDALSFHWLFWIPAIVLVLATLATHLLVPESPVRSRGRINLLAAVLLSGWLLTLLLAVSEGPKWGWSSPTVAGLLVAAVVLAVIWMVVEQRSNAPLIDMRMMRLRVVWTNNLVALLIGVGMYAIFAFLPQFLQTPRNAGYGFGASITESGLLLLPSNIVSFLVGVTTGRLTMRYGGKRVLVAGTAISIVPFLLLLTAYDSRVAVVVAMMILGVGFGGTFAAMSSLVVQGVPVEQTGVASGMNANIRTIGGSIGAAVMSSIVTGSVQANGFPTKAGYTHGFAFLTVATVAAVGAAALVPILRPVEPQVAAKALPHPELGLLAAGTVVGDEPE